MEPDITTDNQSSQDSAIFSALENTVLNNADLVSSSDSGIDTAIGSAVENIQKSQKASAGRIETEAASQARNIQRTGLISQTGAVEGRRGFATQTAVLRDIMNTTAQELKDLDARRQDLLATGEAEAASQIATLQVQSIQLAQQAKQNAVSNMIQASNSMFNFRKLQNTEEQNARENALNTISTLQNIGTLKNADPETLSNLEESAGLPAGTLSDIPEVPEEFEIRQVGSSLIAVDPTDPTNMEIVYTAPKSTKPVDTLSIKETQELGLPVSLAGLTEEDVVTSLKEKTPPQWFREAEEATSLQSLPDRSLSKEWDNFRSNLMKRTAVPDTDGELSFVEQLILAKEGGSL